MSNDQKRFAYLLPNVFTALNLACGFASILLSVQGKFYEAALVILLGAVFDSVDGRVARLTGTQSAFGEQFDSLSDLLTFGVAPGLLVYFSSLINYGRLGMVISFAFVLCGALRLARFNANIDKVSSDNFQGLPIPSGALAMVGLVLFSLEFSFIQEFIPWLMVILMPFYALLMISTIPFYSFKHWDWGRRHKKSVFVFIVALIVLTFTYEEFMIASIINIYVVGSLGYVFYRKGKDAVLFKWLEEQEEDDK